MKKPIILVYVEGSSKDIHPAIYYLKEYAQSRWKGIHILTKIYSREKATSSIIKEIIKENPMLVGFSTYVWNARETLLMTGALKEKKPDVPIILGGPEASYNAQRLLAKRNDIDVIVLDEGERAFSEIIGYYHRGTKDISTIKGILYRENGAVKSTGQSAPLNLNSVGSPFLSGCIPSLYRKTITYETSRGCPFRCAYCSYNMGSYAQMRFFPMRRVLKEISHIFHGKPAKINIVDDNFNINEPRALKILSHIRPLLQKTTVTLFLRADVWKISEKLAGLLAHKDIYCTIGVQSLNRTTLVTANRINNRRNLDYNIKLLSRYKVNFILQFIIGLPGDRYEDARDMIDWASQYSPYDIHLQTLRINPQTAYEKDASKYGIAYKKLPPYTISRTKDMPPEQLAKAQLLASHFESIYKNRTLRRKLFRIHAQTRIPVSKIVEMSLESGSGGIAKMDY